MLDKLFITKLKSVLEVPKLRLVPRSGSEGAEVDCYSVRIKQGEVNYIGDSVDDNSLHVLAWSEEDQEYNVPVEFSLDELSSLVFEIKHYHGLVDHTYYTKREFLWYECTRYYKLASFYALAKYRVPKFFHSKKPLKRPNRIKVLETLDRMTEDNPHKELSARAVSDELYGYMSIFNSKRKVRVDRIQRILESLVESGELRAKDSFNFIAKGKLLVTLEHLKEEKAREDRAESNAVWMRRLTVILVITALFQSGLVRTTYFSSIDWLMQPLLEQIDVAKEWMKTIS
ncbi:hypothetical protein A134_13520 [Vibrio crassostreae 9CS106]|uniref:hypothetical protein n=1 Tax=unclassified Vibrio TaxID=2614977 RepID=UPI0002DE623B|nr:hypothetical protein A134_13520 [Vibrio crassostreae 9CS106]